MKKKIVISIVICLIGVSFFLIVKTVIRIKDKKLIAENISNLPPLIILKTDSISLDVNSLVIDKTLVLIAFNTTCDICKHEIIDILNNIKRFDKVKIVMISSEPMDSIVNFQKKYGLNNCDNIFMGQVNDVYALQKLGIEISPQIFIYNYDRRLVKEFKGETKVDAIIKYMN